MNLNLKIKTKKLSNGIKAFCRLLIMRSFKLKINHKVKLYTKTRIKIINKILCFLTNILMMNKTLQKNKFINKMVIKIFKRLKNKK